MAWDVVTLGEGLVRLTPPTMRRLDDATSFEVDVSGSEANTAVGLARLGKSVLWLSRLTDNSLGRGITRRICAKLRVLGGDFASLDARR